MLTTGKPLSEECELALLVVRIALNTCDSRQPHFWPDLWKLAYVVCAKW